MPIDSDREVPLPLVFCCSGAADVGEIAHRAARLLDDRGQAARFCLAGVGGRVPAHLRKCAQAPAILAIDGCHVGCARRTLAEAGFADVVHLPINTVGLAKGSSPVTDAHVRRVADAAAHLLAGGKPAHGETR